MAVFQKIRLFIRHKQLLRHLSPDLVSRLSLSDRNELCMYEDYMRSEFFEGGERLSLYILMGMAGDRLKPFVMEAVTNGHVKDIVRYGTGSTWRLFLRVLLAHAVAPASSPYVSYQSIDYMIGQNSRVIRLMMIQDG